MARASTALPCKADAEKQTRPSLETGICRLSLENFRSHRDFNWQREELSHVLVQGPNGAGKTNILEALSILAPGRGLRFGKLQDMQHHESDAPWSLFMQFETPTGPLEIGMRYDAALRKREIRVGNEPLKRATDLADYVSVLWLTPLMDGVMRDSGRLKRQFFDRLLVNLNATYGHTLLRYEKLLRERRQLLERGYLEPKWRESLERLMAEAGCQLLEMRAHFLQKMKKVLETFVDGPRFALQIAQTGTFETLFEKMDGEAREAAFFEKLQQSGSMPYIAPLGPHQTKYQIDYEGREAHWLSTGQQKIALSLIIFAACRMRLEEAPDQPMLLLIDDMTAHLDTENLGMLMERVVSFPQVQLWIADTSCASLEPSLFQTILLPPVPKLW